MPTKKELEDRLNEDPNSLTPEDLKVDVQRPRTEADKQQMMREEAKRQEEEAKKKGVKKNVTKRRD